MYWRLVKALVAKRWLPWAIVFAATALSGLYWIAFDRGDRSGRAAIQAQWDAATAMQQQALAEAESEYRQREQALQQANQELSDDLHRQLADTEARYNADLATASADVGRLRQQFRGCAADLSRANAVAGTAGGNDDTDQTGLSAADVRVALRLAADADAAVHRLTACQAYARQLQAYIQQLNE